MVVAVLSTIVLIMLVAGIASIFVNVSIARNVKAIHVLVNSRMTSVLERVEQLTKVLEKSGVEVPPDPNPTD